MSSTTLNEIIEESLNEVSEMYKFDIIVNDNEWSKLLVNYLKSINKFYEFTVYSYPELPKNLEISKINGFPTIYHPYSDSATHGFKKYENILREFKLN